MFTSYVTWIIALVTSLITTIGIPAEICYKRMK